MIDPVALAQSLIRAPSVTPDAGRALDVLQQALEKTGFACARLPFSQTGTPDVDNLYARFGKMGRNFCYAGHLDTVPVGDAKSWTVDPFGAEIKEGRLYGRGAADMKASVATFAAAAARAIAGGKATGSISLLITGDEEGPAINGTAKMLKALAEKGERIDHCVVGEPTSVKRLGDTIKIGRRGTITGRLTITGVQGHVGYPERANNPIPKLVETLSRLTKRTLDSGTAHFSASNLEVTTVDVGNPANNVIPAIARATFNIRFNDLQTAEGLARWMRETAESVTREMGGEFSLDFETGGQPFITKPGPFVALVANAIKRVTGIEPELSTSGGTSDARFIKDYAPVCDFGPVGVTMHKVDENVPVEDISRLTDIFATMIEDYFQARDL